MSKKNRTSVRVIEFIVMYLYMAVICLFTAIFKWNSILMGLLIWGIPGLYFALKQHSYKKDIFQTVIWAIPYGIIVEYVGSVNKAWVSNSIFTSKLFGWASIDILIWGFFYVFFIISIYKYFFDEWVAKKTSNHFQFYLLSTSVIWIIFTFIVIINKEFHLPYIYLQMCIVWALILTVAAIKKLKLFYRAIGVGILLFPIGLLHELVSLQVGHWYFEKGYHIGYLTMFNRWTFPFEEFFWILFVIPVMIILHEYFADNSK